MELENIVANTVYIKAREGTIHNKLQHVVALELKPDFLNTNVHTNY